MKYIRAYTFISFLLLTTLIIVGCQEEPSTPDFVIPSPTNTAPPPTPRLSPTRTPTATPQIQNTPETPTATVIPQPTQPLITQAVINVLNSEDGQPIPGAVVKLSQLERGYEATFLTLEDGAAYFVGLVPSNVPYLVEVSPVSYRPISMELTVTEGLNEFTLQLEQGAAALIATETVNLRTGPGLTFDVVVEVSEGEIFPIIGVSEDQEWIQVLTPEGTQGWVFAELVEIDGDLTQFEVETTQLPQTSQTPAPTSEGPTTPTATIQSDTEVSLTPESAPSRPGRIPFNAQMLYDDTVALQYTLVQLRGVLDRRTPDIQIECDEYTAYYRQIIEIQTYRNVPDNWARIHNLYVNSSNNAIDTNQAIYLQCLAGGGSISLFNFRNARNGVDFSLERLRIGIVAAEELLTEI